MAIIAVIVLLAVAIAGIVIGARQRVLADPATTSAGAAAMAAAATGPTQPLLAPNEVRFAASSDRLPDEAGQKLVRIAEEAKARTKSVVITTLIDSPNYQGAQMELAKKRADAVRRELERSGIAIRSIQIRITPVGADMVGADRGDVFVLELR